MPKLTLAKINSHIVPMSPSKDPKIEQIELLTEYPSNPDAQTMHGNSLYNQEMTQI